MPKVQLSHINSNVRGGNLGNRLVRTIMSWPNELDVTIWDGPCRLAGGILKNDAECWYGTMVDGDTVWFVTADSDLRVLDFEELEV